MTTAGLHSRNEIKATSPRAPSELVARGFHRILLIKPSSLGDVIHALPVLHGLRHRYPDATIDWLISAPLAPVIEGLPQLSEVIRFDRRRYGKMAVSPRIAGEFVGFIQALRKRDYDLVIDLQGLFRTGFLSRASGAPVRIGFKDAREGAGFFYTHVLTSENPDIHAVRKNYLVADLLGFSEYPIGFRMPLSETDRVEADRLLGPADSQIHRRLIAVVPGARWETKVWPIERFAETINALHEEPANHCFLVGGPEDVDRCRALSSHCRRSPVDLSGRTSLRTLAAVVSRADVVVCQDSGVMHLAVALNRPLVCLIGPTNHLRTGPYNRGEDCVRLDLDCAPCYFRRLSQCPHDHRCMRELPSDLVIQAVGARLRFHGGTVSSE